MCTAISDKGLFGRTLDLECSYGESIVISPRNYRFEYLNEKGSESHPAIIGVAHVQKGYPLYYDAVNEHGLCMAGLNFPGNAVYNEKQKNKHNVASYELIPWILSACDTVDSAVRLLSETNVTDDSFSKDLRATPLHWIVSDENRSITVESVQCGVMIYENPFGVLTNNPPFPYHINRITDFLGIDSLPPKNTLCPSVTAEPYSRGMGGIGLPGDYSSSSRFVRAVFAKHHTTEEKKKDISRFFHMMDTLAVPKGCVKTEEKKDVYTVYTSCADIEEIAYYYTTYRCRRIYCVKPTDEEVNSDCLAIFDMKWQEDIFFVN